MEGHENNSAENLLKELLAKADQPSPLFEKLSSIWREEASKKDKILSRLIIDLNEKHKIDTCLLAARAIEDGANCFNVYFVIQDAIPTLTHNIDSLILLLEKLYEGMKGDFVSFKQYLPIEQLTRKQPEFAKELVSFLLTIQKPFVMGYISTIFVTLSESNLANIHSELLSLTNHESIYAIKSAINALSRLSYQFPEDQERMDKSISVCRNLSSRNSVDLDLEIVAAMGNLLKKSEEAKNILLAYAQKDNPEILYQVSHALLTNCKSFSQEGWFKDCLMVLTKTSCSHKGIIHNLDLILFTLLENKKEGRFVEELFIQWAIKSNFSATSNVRVGTLFPSAIHQFIKDKQSLETFITNLLNHDDFKVHQFLFDFAHELSVFNIKDLKLDKKILDNLDFDDLFYICRKILGYIIVDADLISSLIFSILCLFR